MRLGIVTIPGLTGSGAVAHEPTEIVVETEAVDAGRSTRDREDVETTPARVPEDLLRSLPGLHLSAHGGRGKGFQVFYRGFDAEHGADLAVSVEGVPLNEPSNVHAHGYVDLNVVPLSLVRRVTLRPGADEADVGAFGTAGAIDLALGREARGLALRVGGGTDRSGQLTVAWRPERAGPGTFAVGEVDAGLGVAEGRAWRIARVGAGVALPDGDVTARLVVLAAHADFDSPGALRAGDVESGRIGLYDAYPGAGGGRSDRVLTFAVVGREGDHGGVRATAWAGFRALDLRQNFTGFTGGPEGDGTRQQHAGRSLGLKVEGGGRWTVARHPWRVRGGAEITSDVHRQRVDGWGVDGADLGERLAGRLDQIGLAGFVEGELGWAGRIRVVPAVRAAGWRQAVAADDAPDAPDDEVRWLGTVAPRVRVEARPHDRVTLFGGYGRGYRAPRAVGGVLGALVQADTGQVGLRAEPVADVVLTATAFGTWLDDEAVFDHPSGTFVGAGASRRLGAELDLAVEPLRHLALDASVTFADARFVATGAPVPYAPVWLGRIGLGAHEIPVRLGAVSAGLRTLFVAPRPLPDGFRSQGIVSADALLAWTIGRFQVGVQVDNLLGLPWRDGEFVYESWWDLDSPRSQLPTVHLTAGTPPAARLWFEARW